MTLENSAPRKGNRPLVAIVLVGLLCGVGAGFLLLRQERPEAPEPAARSEETPLPRMANLPAREEAPAPVAAYAPDAPALERARKALREGIDAEGAVALAASLPEGPERADAAFLLLEFAAEKGHGEAAFLVARYYDPNEEMPSGTIHKDAQSAYEWYRAAAGAGQAQASQGLERLRDAVKRQADQGSWESRQLLKTWQSDSGGRG